MKKQMSIFDQNIIELSKQFIQKSTPVVINPEVVSSGDGTFPLRLNRLCKTSQHTFIPGEMFMENTAWQGGGNPDIKYYISSDGKHLITSPNDFL